MTLEDLWCEALELSQELSREMENTQRENRIPDSIERWCALKAAHTDLNSELLRGFGGLNLFDEWEDEYTEAHTVLSQLPDTIDRARTVLGGGAR